MSIDKTKTSQHFVYFDEKFFVSNLYKTPLNESVLELFKIDLSITEQERQYFKETYPEVLK